MLTDKLPWVGLYGIFKAVGGSKPRCRYYAAEVTALFSVKQYFPVGSRRNVQVLLFVAAGRAVDTILTSALFFDIFKV